MPKLHFYCAERYPDYGFDLAKPSPEDAIFEDPSVEVDEKTIARWERVKKAYNQMQKELRKFYERKS